MFIGVIVPHGQFIDIYWNCSLISLFKVHSIYTFQWIALNGWLAKLNDNILFLVYWPRFFFSSVSLSCSLSLFAFSYLIWIVMKYSCWPWLGCLLVWMIRIVLSMKHNAMQTAIYTHYTYTNPITFNILIPLVFTELWSQLHTTLQKTSTQWHIIFWKNNIRISHEYALKKEATNTNL